MSRTPLCPRSFRSLFWKVQSPGALERREGSCRATVRIAGLGELTEFSKMPSISLVHRRGDRDPGRGSKLAQVTQQVSGRGRTTPKLQADPVSFFSTLLPVCPGRLGPLIPIKGCPGSGKAAELFVPSRAAALGLRVAPFPSAGWRKPGCCLIQLSPLVLPRASPPNQAAPPVALWCETWMSHVPGLLAITLPADLKNHCINKTNHDGRTPSSPHPAQILGVP